MFPFHLCGAHTFKNSLYIASCAIFFIKMFLKNISHLIFQFVLAYNDNIKHWLFNLLKFFSDNNGYLCIKYLKGHLKLSSACPNLYILLHCLNSQYSALSMCVDCGLGKHNPENVNKERDYKQAPGVISSTRI